MTDVIVTDSETIDKKFAWHTSELAYMQSQIEDLEMENREQHKDIVKLEKRIVEFTASHMGLQLSGALSEVDRLKKKCNRLNRKLKGKHIDE